ncbi:MULTISPECIES: DUF4401 domain-containing protein [Yersinia]|uniref:Membrane protein n=1 Tax=Yersinia frederiksenii TaxID=29484 RepID=A0AAI9ENW4_YERFR|nr:MULTISPECIES: DUF4401 domain-containing protein [Yersinia]MDN0126362.1 DUF4401 domain-containing protein [Yersinia massiliensis]CFQ96359.1 membrane protein [Yersinia frederiksenii]
MDLSSHKNCVMPSEAAESLCRSLPVLLNSPSTESSRLTPTVYQKILYYCGVRPELSGWRRFLTLFLTSLGFLALVAGMVFFIAWNWAAMPKMAKFGLVELLIIALTVVVWWRWYDTVSQSALLALGLSFGGLFALYGQIYQTGADSWELFRAWTLVLLPLAIIGRRNGLWFCTWVIANLAFQLYYASRIPFFLDNFSSGSFYWLSDITLYLYFAVQACCLIFREALAEYAQKRDPQSWLVSRWLPRVIAAYLLATITPPAAASFFAWGGFYAGKIALIFWVITLLVGYGYYRYRRPDLCMLTLGVISAMFVGSAFIIRIFDHSWDVDTLFLTGCVIALWLTGGGAILLHWRRQLYQRHTKDIAPDAMAALLQELRQQQLLNDEQVTEITQIDHSLHLPWYLRAVLALGGWVAAFIILMLLVLLLYIMGLLDSLSGVTLLVPSLIIAALAARLLRARGIGKQHIGLAWAIAATCGLCFSVYLLTDPNWDSNIFIDSLWCLPVLAVMAMVMPSRPYRFMAVTAFVFILALSSGYLVSAHFTSSITTIAIPLLVAAILASWIGVITQQDAPHNAIRREVIASLRHGIPAGLALLCLASIHSNSFDELFWDFSATAYLPLILGRGIAAGLLLCAAVQAFAFRTPNTVVYLPAAILCGVIALFAPGIGFGLVLLLAARYQGSKEELVISAIFLMLYLIYWYYFLSITLLHKSLLLVVTGVVLLGLALAAKKLLPANSGAHNAN